MPAGETVSGAIDTSEYSAQPLAKEAMTAARRSRLTQTMIRACRKDGVRCGDFDTRLCSVVDRRSGSSEQTVDSRGFAAAVCPLLPISAP
jgi:hypothetical protein